MRHEKIDADVVVVKTIVKKFFLGCRVSASALERTPLLVPCSGRNLRLEDWICRSLQPKTDAASEWKPTYHGNIEIWCNLAALLLAPFPLGPGAATHDLFNGGRCFLFFQNQSWNLVERKHYLFMAICRELNWCKQNKSNQYKTAHSCETTGEYQWRNELRVDLSPPVPLSSVRSLAPRSPAQLPQNHANHLQNHSLKNCALENTELLI